MKSYYYIENGQQKGPVSVKLLKQYGVKESTLVWCEGMSGWQQASYVPELKSIFPPPPPKPLPPPKPPTPPAYYSEPLSESNEKCPYCSSYNTEKIRGRIIVLIFRYIVIIGLSLLAASFFVVGALIVGPKLIEGTKDWGKNKCRCNSCNHEF